MDALIPLHYEGNQIWYGGDPVLHWKLRDNKNSNGHGFRLKGEYGYKVERSFIQYVKLYAYYEEVIINGLSESEEGVALPSAIDGSTNYQSFGIGTALEF